MALKSRAPTFDASVFEAVHDYTRPRGRWNHLANEWFEVEGRALSRLATSLDVDVIHAVCEPVREAAMLVRRAPVPVILDGADFGGQTEGVASLHPRALRFEQRALEHASGIMHKGPDEEVSYYDDLGWTVQPHRMQFLDYCQEWRYASSKTKRRSDSDGEVHVVYAGQIAADDSEIQIDYAPLGRWLASHGIHLHLYPTRPTVASGMRALAEEEPRFHLHAPVPFDALTAELAQYDVGLWVLGPSNTHSRNLPRKLRTAMGNKLTAYLEAELPLLLDVRLTFGIELCREHGLAIEYDNDAPEAALEGLRLEHVAELRANVLTARAGPLHWETHIDRLLAFYTDAGAR